VASGGETTISGADANGAVLAYTAGLEQVVLNGAVLVRGHDYTATTGTTITGLSPALVASDVLEVFSFIAFTVANTYTQSQVDGLLDSYVGLRLITPSSVVGGTIGATGAVTFSGASSVTLNGCFSSAYDNYEILISNLVGTAAGNCYFQFTNAGTPDTNTAYHWLRLAIANASVAGAAVASQAQWILGKIDTTKSHINATISNPFTASTKGFLGIGGGRTNSAQFTGDFSNSTSFDGFKLFLDSGTVTGTVRVYGYKN
jgi:hypothetical protein